MYVLNNTLAGRVAETNSNYLIYKYICTHVYVCMHIYIYVCMYLSTLACKIVEANSKFLIVCIIICAYACTYVCMHVCMYKCMYICTRTYVWMYVHVCMYVCMYVSIDLSRYVSIEHLRFGSGFKGLRFVCTGPQGSKG